MISTSIFNKKKYYSKFVSERELKNDILFPFKDISDNINNIYYKCWQRNNKSIKIIYDKNSQPLGHWVGIPIDNLVSFKKIIQGDIKKEEIFTKHSIEWSKINPSEVILYVGDIENYNHNYLINPVILDLVKFLLDFYKAVTSIDGVCTIIESREFDINLKEFNFKKGCEYIENGKELNVYYLSNDEEEKTFKKFNNEILKTDNFCIPEWEDYLQFYDEEVSHIV